MKTTRFLISIFIVLLLSFALSGLASAKTPKFCVKNDTEDWTITYYFALKAPNGDTWNDGEFEYTLGPGEANVHTMDMVDDVRLYFHNNKELDYYECTRYYDEYQNPDDLKDSTKYYQYLFKTKKAEKFENNEYVEYEKIYIIYE